MDNEMITQKVAEHEVRLNILEQTQKEIKSEVNNMHQMTEDIHVMAVEMKNLREDTNNKIDDLKSDTNNQIHGLKEDIKQVNTEVNKMSNEITDIKNAPDKETAHSFKEIRSKAIWLIVSLILGFLLAQAFPNIFK